MKKFSLIFFSIFIISACAMNSANYSKRPSDILKSYKVETLPNGLNFLFIRDEKLPYITLNAFVMNGFASDTSHLTGITNATLSLLSKGYDNLSAEKVASQIEQMGADYEIDVNSDYSTIMLDGLSWHQDKLLNIFSQILLKPDFKEKEIQRYKERAVAGIKERTDQLSYLASEAFEDYFYKDHPYGHRDLGTIADVLSIKRHDILDQYERILKPEHVWIVVVGKYSDDFTSKIEQTFSKWKNKKEEMPNLGIAIQPIHGHQFLFINKSDAAQAEIRFGHKTINRQDADYIPTMIANSILGQGFSSRLMNTIRVKDGLTYSISSDLDMRLHGSNFEIKTFTKNESVGKIITETLRVYDDFYKNGVTSDELETAKRYLIGKFPMLVETPERLAFNLVILRMFGVSDSYLKNYQQNINAVTLEQINKAIHKNFDPQNMKIVIVANKDKVMDQLKGFGSITEVEASQFVK